MLEVVLAEAKLKEFELETPQLNALRADDSLYTVLAHQPPGQIRVTAGGIGHASSDEAKQRADALLTLASASGAQPDLLVSPEYSIPWESVLQAVENRKLPEAGKLWVLGCESLPIGHLDVIRQRLGELAVVIDDDVAPAPRTTQRYRNPLVYIFRTRSSASQGQKVVLLVQYKTEVSGDPDNTEATGMLRGRYVYAFGGSPGEVRLITLVCSDVFGFEKALIDKYYQGLLLLHVQLNNSPRHTLYKKYRQELFQAAGDTELLCLNWAANVVSFDGDGATEHPWNNICGSAWYSRSPELAISDDAIRENHKNGVYYTRHEPIRVHALQFDYQPRVFLLEATKVFHHAIPKPRSVRTGPRAIKTYVWAPALKSWVEPQTPDEQPDDGFCRQLERSSAEGDPLNDVRDVYRSGPVAVERIMAITAGRFGPKPDWHSPGRIDSMQLCEQEFVRRVTVTQDPAPEARDFRLSRFAAMRALAELRVNKYEWPAPVEALRGGFKFAWRLEYPGRNVVAKDGTLATLVHAGMVAELEELDRLDQRVRKTLAGPPREPERLLSEAQREVHANHHYAVNAERFCILYASADGTKHYLSPRALSFTRPAGQPDVDFAAPSPTRLTRR